jgi:hypothetical protein
MGSKLHERVAYLAAEKWEAAMKGTGPSKVVETPLKKKQA